jgi:N-methylhydantoinase A
VSSYRLGIDIGGTFTDITLFDERSGALHILKTPSVPAHPSRAVVNGLREVAEAHGVEAADIGYFVHGTTLALNTLLQRNGARCGLLVTKGFKDLLELQRLRLPNPHEFYADKAVPLVPRHHVREVDERRMADGRVLQPLDEAEVVRAVGELVAEGVEAVTICFLHAYRDGGHEVRAKAAIEAAFPDLYVTASSDVWPQQREYERSLITVINAYVGRAMASYFTSLESEMRDLGVRCDVLSTKSNGGIMAVASAKEQPVQTLLSGPASGVIGAMYVAGLAGQRKIVTFDLGGTSADIAIIDGQLPFSTENKVGDFPMIMPVVDVASIGAGGGSIAWTDSAGVLKVGPASAGADPGPAAYARGGSDATITDAYIVTGILDPDNFLGGRMPLDRARAHAALERLGAPLGLDAEGAADAVLRVATSNMYAELLPLMARYGVDANDFGLLPYGGAGPTHVFLLAREIGIRKVIVPRYPGTLCALGALIADVRGDFIRTVFAETAQLEDTALEERFQEIETEARHWLDTQRLDGLERRIERHVDMRYRGQSFETGVEVPEGPADGLVARITEAFHRRYGAIYGYADEDAPAELINVRVRITGVTPKPHLARSELHDAIAVPKAHRTVRLGGRAIDATVFDRDALQAGDRFAGPAIVEQYDTTTFIPEGFTVRVDHYGNLIGTEA